MCFADTSLPPNNFRFTALNFTSAILEWEPPGVSSSCIYNYTVQIQSNIRMKLFETHRSQSTSLLSMSLDSLVEWSTLSLSSVSTVTKLKENMKWFKWLLMVKHSYTKVHVLSVETRLILIVAEPLENLTVNSIQTPQGGVILYAAWNTVWTKGHLQKTYACIILMVGSVFPIQNPLSSRPPVTHYNVTHNVSVINNQLNTSYTNITIHGALPGHVYYIQVTCQCTGTWCSENKMWVLIDVEWGSAVMNYLYCV